MKLHEEIDIRILVDRLRLLRDSVKQLDKRYSQWTPLERAQIAYPMITYCCELIEILEREETKHEYQSIETI
jgi:hypothetical protein